MLFITGTNVERTSVKKFKREISHDRDIKKLIRIGLSALKWNPILGAIASTIFFILYIFTNPFLSTNFSQGFVSNANNWLQAIIPVRIESISISLTIIIVILTIISLCWEARDYILAFHKKIPAMFRAFKFVFGSYAPKTPLDLWDILQASIMDAQLTTSAERLFNTDVSLIYGGKPYYELLLVDNIYVKWEGPQKKSNLFNILHFELFFRKYSARTILSETERTYFSKDSILQVSNCVFGILFLSEYIQSFIKAKKLKIKSDEKIHVDCSSIIIPNELATTKQFATNIESGDLAYQSACELLGYATNPTFFTFKEGKLSDITLKVCRIDFLGNEYQKSKSATMSQREINSYCRKHGIIRIPVKKLISLPIGRNILHNPLPNFVLNPTKRLISFESALVLGGAEQNIVISNIINHYKWREDSERNDTTSYHYYGFAENVFDACGLLLHGWNNYQRPKNLDFLIGTEGFVYGNYRYIRSKIQEHEGAAREEDRNLAEVFTLTIGSVVYYFVYGYHAIATKIATMKFFVYKESTDKNIREKFIPDDKKRRLTYQLIYPANPTFNGLRDHWDLEDPINSSKSALKKRLEEFEINPM